MDPLVRYPFGKGVRAHFDRLQIAEVSGSPVQLVPPELSYRHGTSVTARGVPGIANAAPCQSCVWITGQPADIVYRVSTSVAISDEM